MQDNLVNQGKLDLLELELNLVLLDNQDLEEI